MNLVELRNELNRLKQKYGARDARMHKILTARTPGGLRLIYPDLFPPESDFTEPMVANMVDIAARDISEVIAPLPTFNCSSAVGISDRARAFADKRTKIVNSYVAAASLQIQMYTAADRYGSYGFVPLVVRLDQDRATPVPQFLDSIGTYPIRDSWGRVKRMYQVKRYTRDDALAMFPELIASLDLRTAGRMYDNVDLVRVWADDFEAAFCDTGAGQLLRYVENPLGRCAAHVVSRPGIADEEFGQFDDVLPVQMAKARFALLTLEAATKAVQAPIAMPNDITELSLGPDSIIKSGTPEKIRRVGLDVPPAAFVAQRDLDQELRQGSRYPDVRTGNTDASIVTGRGVQALMTGFDTQIKTAQAMFAHVLTCALEMCFEADEKVWPDRTREVRGNANGTPYAISYTPSKDIKGDHSVDVTYGLMAGLNPNQALVFGLQARGDRLISRDFLRRQMPFNVDAGDEEAKIDVEETRDALKQAVAGLAQAIPALSQQGQDPSQILVKLSDVIKKRTKGESIEQAISEAFAPPEQPEAPAEEMGQAGPSGMGGGLGGLGIDGLMPDVAPGQAGMPPGGRPDLLTLLAGVGASGKPNLAAGVQRKVPI